MLDPLKWMIGTWHGHGISEEHPIKGTLHVEFRLENSFLVISETLWYASGKLYHEDCTWCYWNPNIQQIIAHQFMVPALSEQRILTYEEKSMTMRWWSGPQNPVILFQANNTALDVQVVDAENLCWSKMTYTLDSHDV
jgi:hypothetical protein